LKYILKKRGSQGDAPLGLLPPLWGREGVILQAAAENKRIETKEDFNKAKNCIFLVKKFSAVINNPEPIYRFFGQRTCKDRIK